MALVTTVVDVATLPVRLGVAFSRTTLQLGRLAELAGRLPMGRRQIGATP